MRICKDVHGGRRMSMSSVIPIWKTVVPHLIEESTHGVLGIWGPWIEDGNPFPHSPSWHQLTWAAKHTHNQLRLFDGLDKFPKQVLIKTKPQQNTTLCQYACRIILSCLSSSVLGYSCTAHGRPSASSVGHGGPPEDVFEDILEQFLTKIFDDANMQRYPWRSKDVHAVTA